MFDQLNLCFEVLGSLRKAVDLFRHKVVSLALKLPYSNFQNIQSIKCEVKDEIIKMSFCCRRRFLFSHENPCKRRDLVWESKFWTKHLQRIHIHPITIVTLQKSFYKLNRNTTPTFTTHLEIYPNVPTSTFLCVIKMNYY